MSTATIPGVVVIADVANAHYNGDDVPEEVEHPETGETVAVIGYHRTDAWRGYYVAEPVEGWRKVGEGCNCGPYPDAPPGTSNAEVMAELSELAEQYGEVVVVVCGGSNVFSMPFDVFARAE